MKTTVRENYHSISIKMVDAKKTSISIKIGYDGYGISASAIPGAEPDLKGITNHISRAMDKYLGKKVDLCGCKNYGEFARKVAATVEKATSWDGVINLLDGMGASS